MTRILCIDRDQLCRLDLNRLLAARGFAVMMAEDGLEGIQKARESQPDLIFMDLCLPWFDYYEVVKQLRAYPLTWNIPIILASVLPADHGTRLAQQAGAQGFVAKPYRVEELAEIIRQHLPDRVSRDQASETQGLTSSRIGS